MLKRGVMLALGGAVVFGCGIAAAYADPLMIVGNDEKLLWDDNGKGVLHEQGKDSVVILDLSDPESPKIVATLPLKNSVIGPPVNVDIDPTGSIALVADSISVTKDGDTLKSAPDDKVYVIDLKAKPIKVINTLTVGQQPSGLSFNKLGTLALVANRAGKSISVLSVHGKDVKVVGTVPTDDIVSHVVFTPDASMRSPPSSTTTRSRCSTSTAKPSPTARSAICRRACGPITSRWRRAAALRLPPTTATPAIPTAASIR